jgi:hypothetical protein
MIQQLLALVFILFFLVRLGWQYYHDQITRSQFILWLIFWFVTGLSIIYIKSIDQLAKRLGFSSSGIQLLLYFAVVIIFYFIFRTRIKLAQMEKDITKLTQHLALNKSSEHKKYES